ncbi:innexin unc-9-like [Saccostrea echinata]|uniref:innexin unc-9-like n=1 Tax=Saccostrea echinata TaxID=191078 RepID=UPI002A7F5581|nr:innexin unc-9-like [Saccostrea echinata]
MEGDDEVNVSANGARYTFFKKTTEEEHGVEVEKTYILSVNLFGNKDDDWADRLNYVVTLFFICAFAAYTTFLQYIKPTPPIDCWCPAEFTDTHVEYVQYHCWISNTYYVPPSEALSQNEVIRRRFVVKYYQWGPVILFFMALLFKLPNILWRLTNVYSGVNVGFIARNATDSQEMTWDERQEAINNLAFYLHRWLHLYRPYQRNLFSKIRNLNCDKRSGNYLTALYMVIKCIYCINVIGQFFLLDAILGQNFYLTLGLDFFRRPPSEINQLGLIEFPRVTLCDFKIRQMSNIQSWTVQCVLPLNMFYEAIFFFLWYWYCFVAMVTCASFLLWMWRVFFPINRRVFIEKLLNIHPERKEENQEIDKKKFHEFVTDFLRQDGAFVLRMVHRNTSDVFATDLVKKLWEHFINNKT